MEPSSNIQLSVVIPAYNEAQRIGATLHRIYEYLSVQPYTSEVIVVSDGSCDRTLEEAKKVAGNSHDLTVLNSAVSQGKGASVKRGVMATCGEYVLFSDADLSTPIEEVAGLLENLRKGYDVAIASRGLPESQLLVRQPWWREKMGRTFNWFVKRLLLSGISDTQCGFKCFKHEVARRLFSRQRIVGFAFDVELLWIARKLGCKIVEVPVSWVDHPLSKVHPVYDSARMLFDVLCIRLYDWLKLYK